MNCYFFVVIVWIGCYIVMLVFLECIQDQNCFLLFCFCGMFEYFVGRKNILQIIYFVFDDGVNSEVVEFYNRLFYLSRVNFNGCFIIVIFMVIRKGMDFNIF